MTRRRPVALYAVQESAKRRRRRLCESLTEVCPVLLRSRGLLVGSVLVAGLTAACSSSELPERPAPPERIVLIVIDTLRQDHVSAYGAHNRTPHIDALAERGQRFTNVVSSYYQTTMSMGSLFVGKTPSLESAGFEKPLAWNGRTWCGMRRLAASEHDRSCIPESVTTLAESMQAAGYWTVGIVTNALLFRPLGFEQGFDDWIEVGAQEARRAGKKRDVFGKWTHSHRGFSSAVAETEARLNSRLGDRFFLYVHFMDVHDYRHLKGKSYEAAVALADRGVGGIIRALEERKLMEGTAIVLISDHGERLGEKHFARGRPYHFGHPSFEEHVRIPMIVAPAIAEDPALPMRTDDVHRLILRLAGISELPPSDLAAGELFVSELTHQVYRRGRWKSFLERETRTHSLIDLEKDPMERVDVAADHAEIVKQHSHRMEELSKKLLAESPGPRELTEDDKRRLRELGYLE